ncbi:MAG: LysR family transcriptional regulator [Ostreibacterium sp.]
MISFKHMEYFIEVAKYKQISKASNSLNVSQSTITMAMQTIENKVNAKLLIRNTKGMRLTYEGTLFLEHAKRIVFSMKEMMNLSDKSSSLKKGEINIAISYTISGYFFASYYAAFKRKYPNIKLKLEEKSRKDIEIGLINGAYDVGLFNVSSIKNREELSFEVILKSKRRLWMDSNHGFLKKKEISLKEIAKEPCIMITVDEADYIANCYWKKYSLTPNVIYKTDSIEAIRSMVSNGSGIAILADLVYRPWSLESKRVEKIDVIEEIPSLDVGVVWVKDKKSGEIAKIFLNFMNSSSAFL